MLLGIKLTILYLCYLNVYSYYSGDKICVWVNVVLLLLLLLLLFVCCLQSVFVCERTECSLIILCTGH